MLLSYRIGLWSEPPRDWGERVAGERAALLLERLDAVDASIALRELYPSGRPVWLSPSRARAAIGAAVATGRLALFRRVPPRMSVALVRREDAAPQEPAPVASVETWWEARVVDELGEPVEGLPVSLSVGGAVVVATDGDGRARRVTAPRPSAGAELADLEAARRALEPRWNAIRAGQWLTPAPRRTFVALSSDPSTSVALHPERPHTLVLQPWVLRADLDGFLFDTSKSFLLPPAVEDRPGLDAPIKRLRQWMAGSPTAHALVVGHTDMTGDPWYNDPLSLERAEAFIAYLEGDVAHWLAWYGADRPWEKRWGAHEDHAMLGAVARSLGLPTDAPQVQAYQSARGLEVDGFLGPDTRAALVADYMALQPAELGLPSALTAHGCGESFPRTEPSAAGVEGVPVEGDDASQRRVEIFLFAGELGVQPPAPGPISAAGSPEYPEWVRRARSVHALSVTRVHTMALRCCDAGHDPIPRAHLYLDDAVLEADEGGVVLVPFREGQPVREIRWGDGGPIYQALLHCAFDADDAGVHRKLHNLGFESVEAFQLRFGRTVTGAPSDVAADVHRWHDHGPPPMDDASASLVSMDADLEGAGTPEVSPTEGGEPSRGTVVPAAGDALVVGVASRDTLPSQPLPKSEVTCEVRRVGSSASETHIAKLQDTSSGGVVFRFEGVSGDYDVRVRRTRASGVAEYAERFGVSIQSPQTDVTLLLEPVPTGKFGPGGQRWGWDERTDKSEPWMSIQQGESDTATLTLEPLHSHAHVHLRVSGSTIALAETEASGQSTTLHIDGLSKGKSHIEAVHDGKVIAKLGVFVAPLVEKTVMIRMVHDTKFQATNIDTAKVTALINKTFAQGIARFTVTRLPPVTCAYDLNDDFRLDCNDWPTDEMLVVFAAAGDSSFDHNLFLMKWPDPLISGPGAGMMDFNQRYGFSFHLGDRSEDAEQRLIGAVHELGHGAFGLDHASGLGEPENLMYNFGRTDTKLYLAQWESMHP